MASIKLYYFTNRGRAETCRLLLAASGVQWDDIRFTREEWPKYKLSSPFGQVPYLEYNGKIYSQSVAIANWIAMEFGFAGKTNLESLRVHEVVQLVQDFISCMVKIFLEQDESKKGRAEICRLLLAASGVQWDDVRLTREEWPTYKANAPFGQVPYLEYNGLNYGQSIAIANFIAREFGFAGKTSLESLRVDGVVQLVQDMSTSLSRVSREKDETKKAELLNKVKSEDLPRFLGFFQKLLVDNGNTGHFVGSELTTADVVVYDRIKTLLAHAELALSLSDYPQIQALIAKVEENPNIRSYLDKN